MQKAKCLLSKDLRNKSWEGIALIFGVLAISILLSYLALAWTEPGSAPPGGNVPAPINVGPNYQFKEGKLGVNSLETATSTYLASSGGRVGIGTTIPGYTLDVKGSINASNFYKNGLPFEGGEAGYWVGAENDIYNINSGNVGIGKDKPSAKLHLQIDDYYTQDILKIDKLLHTSTTTSYTETSCSDFNKGTFSTTTCSNDSVLLSQYSQTEWAHSAITNTDYSVIHKIMRRIRDDNNTLYNAFTHYDSPVTGLKFAKSTDKGETWSVKTIDGNASNDWRNMDMCVGGDSDIRIAYKYGNKIRWAASTDRGDNWVTEDVDTSGGLAGYTSGVGCEVTWCSNWIFYPSQDKELTLAYKSGITWNYIRIPKDYNVYSTRSPMMGYSNGYIFTYQSSEGGECRIKFMKTTDFKTFSEKEIDITKCWAGGDAYLGFVGTYPLYSSNLIYLCYADKNEQLKFTYSNDSGDNWATSTTVDATTTFGCFIRAPSANEIYMTYNTTSGGGLKLAKSTDGGKNWKIEEIGLGLLTPTIEVIDGTPYITYFDYSSDKLMLAKTIIKNYYYLTGESTSQAIDFGSLVDFNKLTWNSTLPTGTSLKFQLASSVDGKSWTDFVGPDGSVTTYYTISGATIWSGHNKSRFLKYRAYLSTTDKTKTPSLDDITITYTTYGLAIEGKMVIDKNGNVGIGTTNPGIYRLYVAGAAYSTGGWQTSDIRLKKNIEELDNVLEKLERINGIKFDWKIDEFPDKGLPKGRQIGILAQEVEKEFPELVAEDNEGFKTLAYERLGAVLLEAIKEEKKEIEDLKVRLNNSEQIVLKNELTNFGLIINENGILEVQKLKAKEIEIERIQIRDKAGNIWCVWLNENGEWQKQKGNCQSNF